MLVRDHHTQRSVRLDYVDPVYLNLIELVRRIVAPDSRTTANIVLRAAE
jgi:hypothetical protein